MTADDLIDQLIPPGESRHSSEVLAAAAHADLPERTVRKAAGRLGIVIQRHAPGLGSTYYRPFRPIGPSGPIGLSAHRDDGAGQAERGDPLRGSSAPIGPYYRPRRPTVALGPRVRPVGFEPLDGLDSKAFRWRGPGKAPSEAPLTGFGRCAECDEPIGPSGRLVPVTDLDEPTAPIYAATDGCPTLTEPRGPLTVGDHQAAIFAEAAAQ